MPFSVGQQAWNRGKTKENDPRVRKISETFKAKGIDNFAQWRCNARRIGRIPNTQTPLARSEQLAFLIGLTLGDGHVETFPRSERLRIPIGNRGKLAIQLPEWIRSDRRYLVACLKGLFEAEGSYSTHAPTYTYNLSFSNRNPALLDEVEGALISLGFHPERRSNAVRLRKKREALRFIELIQFRCYGTKV